MATENETPNTEFFFDDLKRWWYGDDIGAYGPFDSWKELMNHYETICRADKIMAEYAQDMGRESDSTNYGR